MSDIEDWTASDEDAYERVLHMIREGWLDRQDFEEAFKCAEEEAEKERLTEENIIREGV